VASLREPQSTSATPASARPDSAKARRVALWFLRRSSAPTESRKGAAMPGTGSSGPPSDSPRTYSGMLCRKRKSRPKRAANAACEVSLTKTRPGRRSAMRR
jgi:hypothetical protein